MIRVLALVGALLTFGADARPVYLQNGNTGDRFELVPDTVFMSNRLVSGEFWQVIEGRHGNRFELSFDLKICLNGSGDYMLNDFVHVTLITGNFDANLGRNPDFLISWLCNRGKL